MLLVALFVGVRWASAESLPRREGFTAMPALATGLTFSNQIPTFRHLTNQMLLDGSGVAAGDFDLDGLPDVFLGSAGGKSTLWRNRGGWRFEDVTARAFAETETALAGDVTGSVFADLNGDSAPDLVLNTHADGVRILLNTGRGVFRRLPFRQAAARGGHSLALADVDGDGWVDLYVCNYRQKALMDMPNARATFRREGGQTVVASIDGRSTTEPDLAGRFLVTATGAIEELGEPDVLYLNRGGTNFTEVPWTGGAFLDAQGQSLGAPPADWGLAAQFCDVNDDGRPDLYVCNDFQSPDRFWINESTPGSPRFRMIAPSAVRHTSQFSMGVDFSDLDADGRPDFVVLDMLSPDPVRRLTMLDGTTSAPGDPADSQARLQFDANTLFLQRPDGSFREVAALAGVMATDWSWTPVFLDVDLDGWPDLLVSAGQERGSRDLDVAEQLRAFRRGGIRSDAQIFRERQKFPRLPSPLKVFRHRGVAVAGDVPRFDDVSTRWGLGEEAVSHGMALADLDGDGDLDLVVNRMNASAGLFRNDATAPRVSVRLQGMSPNTGAVGARLRFSMPEGTPGGGPVQWAQVLGGGRYLSGDAPSRTFACPGGGQGVLEVRWPSGKIEVWTHLLAGTNWVLREGSGEAPPVPRKPRPPGRLRFELSESSWNSTASSVDEWAQQPGLPRRQRTRNPALLSTPAGLLVGGDELQPVQRLGSNGVPSLPPGRPPRPTTGLAVWSGGVIGVGPGRPALFRLDATTLSAEPLDGGPGEPSCIATSPVDGSGRGWVFVGGGPVAGRYPEAASSALFLSSGSKLVERPLPALGLVNAAVFVPLGPEGGPGLAAAMDWGAPQLLRLTGDSAEPWDPPVTFAGREPRPLSSLTGWWQSLLSEDFDGDGRRDLVLGNWGLNSAFALHAGPADGTGAVRPLFLYPGSPEQPGACVEAFTGADGVVRPIRGLSELGPRYPWLQERFSTHRGFALASMAEVLVAAAAPALPPRTCRQLGSIILLNRGDRFEGRLLPDAVQLGPVMALASADFDGDGHRDVYCAQGFFGHNFGVGRDDAGEGVFLLGRGDGTFEAVASSETGVRLLGEQRAVVAGDQDGDGRPDLAVGIQGGPVVFLRNRPPR